jgi:hypothetical protein
MWVWRSVFPDLFTLAPARSLGRQEQSDEEAEAQLSNKRATAISAHGVGVTRVRLWELFELFASTSGKGVCTHGGGTPTVIHFTKKAWARWHRLISSSITKQVVMTSAWSRIRNPQRHPLTTLTVPRSKPSRCFGPKGASYSARADAHA